MTNTDTDTDTLIDLAADRIGATAYAGATTYGWRDDASGEVCLASPEQLADLGMRLAAGEPDAYSLWCSELSLESATPAEVAASFPDLAGEEVDIAGLRAEASVAEDLLTVAVCDLDRPGLARAFEAEEADDAHT